MPYFETEEAKAVYLLAQTAKSASDLEKTPAFQNWRNTNEGNLLLKSDAEFIQVEGPLPSWNRPVPEVVDHLHKNEWMPIVVAVDVYHLPAWCQPSVAATVSEETIVVKYNPTSQKTSYYTDCSCSMDRIEIKNFQK